jgi:hypothetical protein
LLGSIRNHWLVYLLAFFQSENGSQIIFAFSA